MATLRQRTLNIASNVRRISATSFRWAWCLPAVAILSQALRGGSSDASRWDVGYDRTLELNVARLNDEPDSVEALVAIADVYRHLGNPIASEKFCRRILAISPDDWHARVILINDFQLGNNFTERDSVREELFALWKSSVDRELSHKIYYTRDEFSVCNFGISALEFFDVSPNLVIRWKYSFLPFHRIDGKLRPYWISFLICPWLGQQHYFIVYEDAGGSFVVLRHYNDEPTYDEIRKEVEKIVREHQDPGHAVALRFAGEEVLAGTENAGREGPYSPYEPPRPEQGPRVTSHRIVNAFTLLGISAVGLKATLRLPHP